MRQTWGRRTRHLGVVLTLVLTVAACLTNGQTEAALMALPVSAFTATATPVPTAEKLATLAPTVTLMARAVHPVSPQTVTITPTVAVTEQVTATLYTVQAGDTLSGIAVRFQTTIQALQAANQLSGDLIYPEQVLQIPPGAPRPIITPTATPVEAQNNQPARATTLPTLTPVPAQSTQLSVLEGDLASAYPATFVTQRFTLHFAPGTIPADHPQLIADILTRALAHHEQMLHVTLAGRFDAYIAGAPFQPPDQSLRGHSYSAQRYFVFLDDGTGNLADLNYLAAHELTHMFTWLVFGRPTDPMLSEGAAVYVGMDFIAQARHLPIKTFCAAYSQAGVLPHVSAHLRYQGHLRDLENYYAGGCFVGYLIEKYGAEKFGLLYPSNDYVGIYGKTLKQLDDEWHAAVAATPIVLPFAPIQLVRLVNRLEAAHANLFDPFTGTAQQMARYRALDLVRLALLEGRLADVEHAFASLGTTP